MCLTARHLAREQAVASQSASRWQARFGWAALLGLPVAFLLLFYAYPLVTVLGNGLDATAWQWLVGPYARQRIAMGFFQAILSVLATFLIAVPLATLYHRFRIPEQRWHLALHAAPFVLPVFVVVFGLREVGVLSGLSPLAAVVVAHAYYNYGFAARLLATTLENRPRAMEAASQVHGASPWATWLRVTLPLLAPQLIAIALLVFLFSLTSFGVVLLLGANEVWTIETLLYQQVGGAFPRYERAAALATVQLALNATLLWAYLGLRRQALPAGPSQGSATRPPSKGAKQAARLVGWLALAVALAPVIALLAGGFQVRGRWSLEPWRALLDATHPAHRVGFDFVQVLDRTVAYALMTALVSVALALLWAAALRQAGARAGGRRRWWQRGAELAAGLPLGTSSVILGLAFLLAFGAVGLLDLRGTRIQIIIAHTLVAFPFAARILIPAMHALDPRLGEAAAVLGASAWARARAIYGPLLRPALAAAAGLTAAISIGDFGASLVLMRTDNMSLAVWVHAHDRPFDPLARSMATALAGVLMVLAAASMMLAERFAPREVRF